ncbi:polyketide synthase dehydratase domain-containing protein [Streptomyces sp. M19]
MYQRLAAHGYVYGPVFQGLEAAWRLGDEVYAQVRLPHHGAADAGADGRLFGLHPALLDASLHALALEEIPPPGPTPLAGEAPVRLERVRLYAAGASALRVRLTGTGPEPSRCGSPTHGRAGRRGGRPVGAARRRGATGRRRPPRSRERPAARGVDPFRPAAAAPSDGAQADGARPTAPGGCSVATAPDCCGPGTTAPNRSSTRRWPPFRRPSRAGSRAPGRPGHRRTRRERRGQRPRHRGGTGHDGADHRAALPRVAPELAGGPAAGRDHAGGGHPRLRLHRAR